jgi:hypothetical protein
MVSVIQSRIGRDGQDEQDKNQNHFRMNDS